MRKPLCVLSLLCLALAASAKLSDSQKLIRKLWGQNTDLIRAKLILEEEGAKVGMTGDEYLDECAADAERMAFTDEEYAQMMKERMDVGAPEKLLGTIKIETKGEVLKAFKKHFPKSYAIVAKRIDMINEHNKGMDAEAQKFVRETGETILEAIVFLSQSSTDKRKTPMELLTLVAKDFTKIVNAYLALPQSSKNALDRAFCARASVRIIDNGGQLKEFVAMMALIAEGGNPFE